MTKTSDKPTSEPTLAEQITTLLRVTARLEAGRVVMAYPDDLAALRAALATLERQRDLFVDGEFVAHSGDVLPNKVDCDALSDTSIATLAKDIARRHEFGSVIGIPTGGDKLAAALAPYVTEGAPPLVIDDVLTTGRSMNGARQEGAIGVVIFARGDYADWIAPLWVAGEVVVQRERAALERSERLEAVLAQLLHECVEAGFESATDYNWPKALADAKAALSAADARPR